MNSVNSSFEKGKEIVLPEGLKLDKTKKVSRYAQRIQALLITPEDEKDFLKEIYKNRSSLVALGIAEKLKLKTV